MEIVHPIELAVEIFLCTAGRTVDAVALLSKHIHEILPCEMELYVLELGEDNYSVFHGRLLCPGTRECRRGEVEAVEPAHQVLLFRCRELTSGACSRGYGRVWDVCRGRVRVADVHSAAVTASVCLESGVAVPAVCILDHCVPVRRQQEVLIFVSLQSGCEAASVRLRKRCGATSCRHCEDVQRRQQKQQQYGYIL